MRAYDNLMQEAVRAGAIRARQEMAERQSRTAVLGQNLAVTALMELQERLQQRGKRRGLTAYEACRLFEACSKIERICRGEPDAKGEVAAIHIHIEMQTQPRYQDAAAEAIDAENLKNLDS